MTGGKECEGCWRGWGEEEYPKNYWELQSASLWRAGDGKPALTRG